LDIELAPFFLRHLISRKNLNYSCFDDLMFLDRDLYNNLNFIKVNKIKNKNFLFIFLFFVKHYDGDVSSLALTYSIDEDVLGELMTYDIIPCGRHVNVTNDDKYVLFFFDSKINFLLFLELFISIECLFIEHIHVLKLR